MTGLSVGEAENVLRKYFGTYRGLDTYLHEAADRAVRDRQARTGIRPPGAVSATTSRIASRFP